MRSSMYQTEPRWDGAILYGSVAILGILQVEIMFSMDFPNFPSKHPWHGGIDHGFLGC